MLTLPAKGFGVSVNQHNVSLDALVDWTEACITFVDDRLSHTDVLKVLLDEGRYRSQDFARERIADAWLELERRSDCLRNGGTYAISSSRIERTREWQDAPAFSFCLMVSLQVPYRSLFIESFGNDYTQQGLLFERLTAEAIAAIGWRTHATGWSKNAAASIAPKVEALAEHLSETSRPEAIEPWTDEKAKDAGLDVVCHLPFADGWSGRPLLYMQCASGENWKDKRATPNLALWDKLLDLATRPRRGLAVPFAFLSDDFRRAANYDMLSLFLDRHRLCAPPTKLEDWLSSELSQELNVWTESRLTSLLKARAD